MGKADVLLEIGCEELPAGQIEAAAGVLARSLASRLSEAGLGGGTPRVFSTPRRLAVIIPGVGDTQPAKRVERRGPSVAQGRDEGGGFSKAAIGFAKGQQMAPEDLVVRTTPQGDYFFAVRDVPGRPAPEVIAEAAQAAAAQVRFSRTMRWGDGPARFLRPVRWLVAMFGEAVVPLKLFGISAGGETFGLRFHSAGPRQVGAESYERVLHELLVEPDRERRAALIESQAAQLLAPGEALHEAAPLEELVDLTEWPVAFRGRFDPAYLEVPAPVLVTTMVHHQRYMPVVQGGELAPAFIGVANGPAGREVVSGNERVLAARLADARFFYRRDRATALSDLRPKLKNITWIEGLGTLFDRASRLEHLASEIDRQRGGDGSAARSAAALSLCDLATQMVYEFPELSGVMGGVYARHDGVGEEISRAVSEVHLPASGKVPETAAGWALALADKLDHLAGCFVAGLQPKGSQDPLGVRRAAIGALTLLRHEPLAVRGAVQWALDGFSKVPGGTAEAVVSFLAGRLSAMLEEDGLRPEVVASVMAAPWEDVPSVFARAVALQKALADKSFEDLLTAYRRAANLGERGPIDEGALDPDEAQLLASLKEVEAGFSACRDRQDFEGALLHLARLRGPLDRFFERVMVMSEDEQRRLARRALLFRASHLTEAFADLSGLSFALTEAAGKGTP